MFAMFCSNLMVLFETLNSFLSNTNWYEYLNAISRLSIRIRISLFRFFVHTHTI